MQKINRVNWKKSLAFFAENKINILAISIASSDAFGVLKFVVDKSTQAYKILKEKGFTVSLEEVLAIEMVDKPGGLHHIAEFMFENILNIENAHVLILESRKRAYLLVEGPNIKTTQRLLKKSKIPFFQGNLEKRRTKK